MDLILELFVAYNYSACLSLRSQEAPRYQAAALAVATQVREQLSAAGCFLTDHCPSQEPVLRPSPGERQTWQQTLSTGTVSDEFATLNNPDH